jgi:hypothetical protein
MIIAICVCFMVAWVGGGAAFLWFGDSSVPNSSPKVSFEYFEEYRHEIAGILQRDHEMLQAQDAEIKRLSDQFSQLITKIDSLGIGAREAQAAVSSAGQKAAPKKPAAKPALPITTAPPEQSDKR